MDYNKVNTKSTCRLSCNLVFLFWDWAILQPFVLSLQNHNFAYHFWCIIQRYLQIFLDFFSQITSNTAFHFKSNRLDYVQILVMSPSWNFPARAEPSYKGSKPSRAELGHFNFRAETELTICTVLSSRFFNVHY